ncbi:MAG: C25 family cysteine peptidase, partial [Candidatus Thorarchaeota archaeon]
HNMIYDSIFPSDWSATFLAETEGLKTTDYYYDRSTNSTNLAEEIEVGVGIAMYDAHGSTTGMYRSLFTKDYDGDLLFDQGVDESDSELFFSAYSNYNVSGKLGFYFLCACSTGTFRYSSTCLSEAVVRNFGIGCIASSESAGYDPFLYDGEIGWSTQGLAYRFWEQLLTEGINQPGKAFVQAKIDYVFDFAEYEGEADDDTKTLVQYNLMGDPEVPIWTTIPNKLNAEIQLDPTDGVVTINALSGGSNISHAMVTLTTANTYFRGLTNSFGVRMPLTSIDELDTFDLTISKNGYLPFQRLSNESLTILPDMSEVTMLGEDVTTIEMDSSTEPTTTRVTPSLTTTILPPDEAMMTMVLIVGVGGAAMVLTAIVFRHSRREM